MSTVLSLLAVNGRPASSAYHRGGPHSQKTDALLASRQADTLLSSDQLLQQLKQSRISTPIFGSSVAQTQTTEPRPQTEYGIHFNSRLFHVPPPGNSKVQPDSRTVAATAPAAVAVAAAAPAPAAAAAVPSQTTTTLQAPKPCSTLTTTPPSQPDHPLNAQRTRNTQYPTVPTSQSSLFQPYFSPPNPNSTLTMHASPSSTKLVGPAVGTSSSPFHPQTHRRSANNNSATSAASPHPRTTDGGAPRVRPHACKPHRPGSILVPLPSCASAPAQPSESLVGSEKLHSGWSGSLIGSSSTRHQHKHLAPAQAPSASTSKLGGQPGAKHAVPGAAGVLPPSKDHPAFASARSCPSRPSTANPITHSLVDIPSKASFPHPPPSMGGTSRGLPAWPCRPGSMRANSPGAIVCSHKTYTCTTRDSSRPGTGSTSCNRPLLGPSCSMPTSSGSSSSYTGPSHAMQKHSSRPLGLQGDTRQHGLYDAHTRQHGLYDAHTRQHADHGRGAAAAAAHALSGGAGTAAAAKLPPDAKDPHTAQQQPRTPAPAHPLCCSTSTPPSPPPPAPLQPVASRTSPSQSNQAPAMDPPTAGSTPAPPHTAPHTHGNPSSKGPQEQQHPLQGHSTPTASASPPQPAPLSSPPLPAPSSPPKSCHQACLNSTRPNSSASSVWSTLVQAPTSLLPTFPNAQPAVQAEGGGTSLDPTNAQAAAPALKYAATASQMAQQEKEAQQQLEQLQRLRGTGPGGLHSSNCRDSRPDTPWTVQVAKAAGQASDDDATSIDIVGTTRPGTSTTGSRAFTPVGKPYNLAGKKDQQRSSLAPFVRQAAPMVLSVDEPAQSSEEVLEMELQRKLRELSLDELRQINALL